ncbi:hypothetical protein RJT34_09367 [Clitoria ternatea]|uniref:Uncharacterized protein n=1 Tax=Clitoria ternatea TaxID=43366 RepID=A0AAN9PVD2_CLITE
MPQQRPVNPPVVYSEYESRVASTERALRYQQTTLSHSVTTMFYIVNFYGAIQLGVLILIVNHTARMVCKDSWDFVIFSTVIAVFNITIIVDLSLKYFSVYRLYINTWESWKRLESHASAMGWHLPVQIIDGPIDEYQLFRRYVLFGAALSVFFYVWNAQEHGNAVDIVGYLLFRLPRCALIQASRELSVIILVRNALAV